MGKIIASLCRLQLTRSVVSVRDRLTVILASDPWTRHEYNRRTAILGNMLRLTEFYCNRVAATITIQRWRQRTTQSLVLQKYVALYRQRAQSHLLKRQDAARIIRHCYQRFIIRRQLRLPELARACAEAAATLDVAKAAAASLPVDSNSFDVWIAESRHRHTIAMFDYQLQQIARRIDWIDCRRLKGVLNPSFLYSTKLSQMAGNNGDQIASLQFYRRIICSIAS